MRPPVIAAGLLALLGAAAVAVTALQSAPAPATPAKKLFVVGVLSGLHEVDLATGKELGKVYTGVIPHNVERSADGKRLYVSNVGSQSVSVIDVATRKKIRDILVGKMPEVPAHAKVDARALAKANSCAQCHQTSAVGSLPNAMAWSDDRKHLLVNEIRTRAVSWLDPAAGKTVRQVTFDLPTPTAPANMGVNPANGEIWVVHRWEPHDRPQGTVKNPAAMGDFSHDPPAGQHYSWVTVHDREMKQELARLKMPWAVAFDMEFSPDGRWLYVGYRSSNDIAVFDTRTRKLAKSHKVGATPTGLALSPDGKYLYVTCLFARPAVLQMLDTETGEIEASFGIPPSPSLVKVDPATGLVYVTATGYNAVLEIDPVQRKLLRELPAGHQPLDLQLIE